ncbi:hypothetical protein D3878_23030 [Noviherbaspirillum sedimenti]|uniref:Uncharacterized protein n=1 Tax=Noviherbaspirillum sedimenti TaxID=2320865 RepID=A0A3A3GP56_9BURK|nr:hypothetical protein D3878_23030 [Noviherbaspirillum sedimenti]
MILHCSNAVLLDDQSISRCQVCILSKMTGNILLARIMTPARKQKKEFACQILDLLKSLSIIDNHYLLA